MHEIDGKTCQYKYARDKASMHVCAVWLMHCWLDMQLIFINAYVRNGSLLVVKWPTLVLYAQGKEGFK